MSDKYQGWTNYPTWAAHLWITNEEGLFDETRELVKRPYKLKVERDDALKYFIEDYLFEGLFQETFPESSMAADIFRWALALINWREIADALEE